MVQTFSFNSSDSGQPDLAIQDLTSNTFGPGFQNDSAISSLTPSNRRFHGGKLQPPGKWLLRVLRILTLPILLSIVIPVSAIQASPDTPHAIWPEIFLPGYNAFRNESYVGAGFMLLGRILTFYGAYHYHNRYVNYNSAASAARVADLYYGPGLEYADPYSRDYLSSQEMENRAGRSQNYSHLAIAIHLGLTGAGLFQGYRIQQGIQERNLKELQIKAASTGHRPGLQYTWRIDF